MMLRFTEDSSDPRTIRVVIIGGGAAGLSALAALMRRPHFDAILLERQADIGGVWYQCDYPGLSLHSRSYSYKFHDFPPPPSDTEHATRNEILEYFSRYVESLGMAEHVHCHKHVGSVTFSDDAALIHKCHIHVEDLIAGQNHVLKCDYVICATGFSNAGVPTVPKFLGEERFTGKKIHSSELAAASLSKIKKKQAHVCLLGAGKSAYDLALQFAKHELLDRVTWVYRKSLWGLNYDFLYSDRPDKLALVMKHSQYLHTLRRFSEIPPVKELAREIVDGGMLLNVARDHGIYETRSAIYKPAEIELLKSNVRQIRSWVESLHGTTARLYNGASVEADYLVCCTGYGRARDLPVFQLASQGTPPVTVDPTNRPMLYRGMIDTRAPRLILFTGETIFPSQIFGFSVASEWAAHYIETMCAASIDVPAMSRCLAADDDAVNGKVREEYRYSWAAARETNSGGFGYFAGEASSRYLHQIFDDLGVEGTLAGEDDFAANLVFAASTDRTDFERLNQALTARLGEKR
jgi:thioredoxin reductase